MTDAASESRPEDPAPQRRRKDERPHRSRGLTAFAASLLFLISLVATNQRPWGVIFWIGTGILATWIWIAAWDEPAKQWWRRAGAIVTLAGWVLGVSFVMSHPAADSERNLDSRHRTKCAANLHQMDRALRKWTAAHDGRYPDRLEQLLEVEPDPAIFVCPAAGDVPATGPTTRDVADQLTSGGHLSFVYLGKGLITTGATGDTVLVYEPLTNHHADVAPGIHVLTADGSVKWLHERDAEHVTTELRTGHNPPRAASGK